MSTHATPKDFRTYGKQLKLLKGRGLNINPVIRSREILQNENYYNLINGYKSPFLMRTIPDDEYKANSSLLEIYSLYKFDRNIRGIFINEVLKIENTVKAIIAYNFSEKYGHKDKDYLKVDNFKPAKNNEEHLEMNEFICKLMRLIWKKDSPHSYIEHYRNQHGYVPLWVLVNSMTFGDLSKFYSYMKDRDRGTIAKTLSKNKVIYHNQLQTYLIMIGVYRNILAHDERFYEYKKKRYDGRPYTVNYQGYLGLRNVDSSVFALTICLKILLDTKDFEMFFQSFLNEINKLSDSLSSISINDILKEMNFIMPLYSLNSLSDIKKLVNVD